MMTRKDYATIAEALATAEPWEDKGRIARRIADILERDNPRFDRKRFYDAANVERASV